MPKGEGVPVEEDAVFGGSSSDPTCVRAGARAGCADRVILTSANYQRQERAGRAALLKPAHADVEQAHGTASASGRNSNLPAPRLHFVWLGW